MDQLDLDLELSSDEEPEISQGDVSEDDEAGEPQFNIDDDEEEEDEEVEKEDEKERKEKERKEKERKEKHPRKRPRVSGKVDQDNSRGEKRKRVSKTVAKSSDDLLSDSDKVQL